MSRLHYVRGTPEDTKEVHQANTSNNKYRLDKRNYPWSWYSEHVAPGYYLFQQFRNEHGFQTNEW